MGRRRHDEESSLELLLDTICNVFGGVVFIAILLALLSSAAESDLTQDTMDASTLADTIRRQREVQQQHRDYQQAVASIDESIAGIDMAAATARADLLDRLTETESQAEQRLREDDTWLAAFEASREEQAAADGEMERELSDLESELRDLEAKLDNAKSRRTVQARLHAEQRTQKRQLVVMMKENKVFFVPLGTGEQAVKQSGAGAGVELRSYMLGLGIQVVPRKVGGVSPVAVPNDPAMKRLAVLAPPRTYFLEMFVFDDSVEAYQAARVWAVQMGYQYNINPVTGNELVLGARDTPTFVQ